VIVLGLCFAFTLLCFAIFVWWDVARRRVEQADTAARLAARDDDVTRKLVERLDAAEDALRKLQRAPMTAARPSGLADEMRASVR
jgi:hypothetical protein